MTQIFMVKTTKSTCIDFGEAFTKLGYGNVVNKVNEEKRVMEESKKNSERISKNRVKYFNELEDIKDVCNGLTNLSEIFSGYEIDDSLIMKLEDMINTSKYRMHKKFNSDMLKATKVLYDNDVKIVSQEVINNFIARYSKKEQEILNRR